MCVFVCVSGHRCRCLCVSMCMCISVYVCVCQGIWVRVSVCVNVHVVHAYVVCLGVTVLGCGQVWAVDPLPQDPPE